MPLQHRTDTVGSLRMHYVLDGSGPLVLLLHGFPEFWWSWRFQIAPLAAAALNTAGKPRDPDAASDIEAIGIAVLERLRLVAALLHHKISLGEDEPVLRIVLAG